MMPTLVAVVAAASFGPTVVTADTLAGGWTLTAIGYDGYEVRGTAARPMKVTFANGLMTTTPGYRFGFEREYARGTAGNKSERRTVMRLIDRDLEATYRLDASKTPAHLDVVEGSGAEQAKRLGICRTTGGKLEICLGTELARPTEFKSGVWFVLLSLEPAKKNAKAGVKLIEK